MYKNLKEGWELFAKKCIPDDAPPVQRQEMRRAFYAGGAAFYEVMMSVSLVEVPDEVGIDTIKVLEKEIRQFALDVVAGKA